MDDRLRAELQAVAQTIEFASGDVILRHGQQLPGMHFVRRGIVRVVRRHMGKDVEIATLKAGESFGEISFLEGAGASATVIAASDAEIGFVSNGDLKKLFETKPELGARFYRMIAMELAARLRETTAMIPLLLRDAERREQE